MGARPDRVLCQDDARPFTRQIVQTRARRAAKRAGVLHGSPKSTGGCVHILRHTFCSHLAMRGAPARAIQELAGHKGQSMTQRYMHLSPAVLDAATRPLEQPSGHAKTGALSQSLGDIWSLRIGEPGFAPVPDEPLRVGTGLKTWRTRQDRTK